MEGGLFAKKIKDVIYVPLFFFFFYHSSPQKSCQNDTHK